ncbi:MAG: PDZ domain-containing protein [Streptosporangiales bacterium]|nr:PDZ domain-containing protein [Streptosporangiales bacterium]
MSRIARRAMRGSTVLTAVAVAYAGGVATGVIGSDEPPERPARQGVIDGAADQIAERSADRVSRRELERAAVDGMLQAVDDPWSRYYTPAEYRDLRSRLDGHYSGVGLWLREGTGERVEVMSVQPASPAARAGIHASDAILRVDGRSTADAKPDDVASALRGRPNTRVTLVISRDADRRELTLVRTELSNRAVTVRQLDDQVMMIRISDFTRGVGRRVWLAMNQKPSRHAGGVVLDLRGNPGGLLDEAVESSSAFLDGGSVVSYARRGAPVRRLDAVGGGDTTTPLVVLVDGTTASAAEVVAGALRDRNRAVIVGSRTFGKSSVQEPRRLPDGSALELTVGRYLTPSGHDIDKVGITPDVTVASDSRPQVAERRALDVLAGLLASLPYAERRG